jgi:hypothetical protein
MLVVERVAKVRRLHFVQRLAIKAICRELGLSRKVVRKVQRTGATEFRYERTRQPMPKLGAWQGELDRLLEQNAGRASRGRLTLMRVFEALRGLGYEGGYDTVRRYARGWSQSRTSTAAADTTLVKAPAGAVRWRRMMEAGCFAMIDEPAAVEKISSSYVSRLLRLALLAPDIVEAILDGRQPEGMTLPGLMEQFLVEWEEQPAICGGDLRSLSAVGISDVSLPAKPAGNSLVRMTLAAS